MSGLVVIGIDPGVATGLALWNTKRKAFTRVESCLIHEAMATVRHWHDEGWLSHVVFEDARLRTGYFGKNAKAKQQGAGSVKRDCTIWADFLGGHGIPFKTVSPRAKGAKVDAETFIRLTAWVGRTNEHGRDAAMLVIGAKEMVPA